MDMPLDQSHVAAFVSSIDPARFKTAAREALRRTEERRVADVLPPDEDEDPDPPAR